MNIDKAIKIKYKNLFNETIIHLTLENFYTDNLPSQENELVYCSCHFL